MDSGAQDQFIQKKLIYKFDKKIDAILQEYFRRINGPEAQSQMLDQNQTSSKKIMTKQQMLQQIDQLMFQNFKYRTAIISAKKDQQFNEQILQKQQTQIVKTKQQIKQLSNDLNKSLIAKRNKEQYNILAKTIKKYEGKAIQDQKLKEIQEQIERMQGQYEKQIAEFKKKQKCLKVALAALKGIIQWDSNKDVPSNFQNNKEKQASNFIEGEKNQREEGESYGNY